MAIPRIRKRRGSGWEYLRGAPEWADRPVRSEERRDDPDAWLDRFFVSAIVVLTTLAAAIAFAAASSA